MKKRILSLLLTLCLLLPLLPLPARAATSGTCGDDITWRYSGNVLYLEGSGRMYDFNEHEAPWYSLGPINAMRIDDDITYIGDYAFEDNWNFYLREVDLPDSLVAIGDRAFLNWEDLTSIEIPDSVTSIGTAAFINCKSLEYVDFPDNLRELGAGAFRNCESLASAELPASLTVIQSQTFEICDNLRSVTMPGVTIIGDSAFSVCKQLSYIEMNSVTKIGDEAFSGCSALRDIEFPASLVEIGENAFRACGFTSLRIPASVKKIRASAFANLQRLETVKFLGAPPSTFVATAFDNSSAIAYYPSGYGWTQAVFSRFPNMDWRPYDAPPPATEPPETEPPVTEPPVTEPPVTEPPATQPPAPSGPVTSGSCGDNATWSFSNGVLTIRGTGEVWYGEPIPWADCQQNITSIVVQEGITELGDFAFEGCSAVTSVSLPQSLRIIGRCVFCNCTSLQSITIPQNVHTLESNIFLCYAPAHSNMDNPPYNGSLREVIFEGDCPTMARDTFGNATPTAYYPSYRNWPDHMIEDNWVAYGPSGPSATEPPVTEPPVTEPPATQPPATEPPAYGGVCGEDATWSYDNGTLTIRGSGQMQACRTWEDTPWANCYQSVTRIVIGEGITGIGASAFFDFDALTSVSLPSTLLHIGAQAFYGSDRLTTVTIPENVIKIWDQAFGHMDSLATVYFEGDAPEIIQDAFAESSPTMYYPRNCNWPAAVMAQFSNLNWQPYGTQPPVIEPPVTEPPVTEPPVIGPTIPTITGTYTTELVMYAEDLGVNAPDSILQATLTFGAGGTVSCTWEALDLTALRIFFHDMFVNAYYAMAYGAGITDIAEIERFCMESTGMSVSDYMDTLVTDQAMIESFTPAPTSGTYCHNADHSAILTNLPIMDVPSNPSVENSFFFDGNILYLNAASWDKPNYTFICTRK